MKIVEFSHGESISMNLDEQQYAAVVAHADKPVLVLAGAGSGKTRVLTYRVAELIDEHGFSPETMIVTTFTRKAADELKEKLMPMIGEQAVKMLMCNTIHGNCLRMLREEGLVAEVITGYEKKKLLEDAIHQVNWDCGHRYPEYWISRLKSDVVDPALAEGWLQQRLGMISEKWQARDLAQKLAMVYRMYERDKTYLGRIDFDDMPYMVAKRLREDITFKQKWQQRIKTVLIDEAQDDMRIAVEILETIAAPENRVFIVGDDFQTLFRWNLADPTHNIFGFMDRYPSAQMFKIETNYRSTQKIVELGNRLVQKQYVGENEIFRKELKFRPGAPVGDDVAVKLCLDVYEEADWVLENTLALLNNGSKPKDVYVIYRTNAQSRAIEDVLIRAKIPYLVQGSLGFYDRAVVKDVLAYLAMVEDKEDNEAFRRCANIASVWHDRHYRGFGAQFYNECQSRHNSMWYGMMAIKPYQKNFKMKGIEDFETLIQFLELEGEHSPSKTIGLIREHCYDTWLRKKEGLPEGVDTEIGSFDDLEELMEAARRFRTNKEMLRYVEEMKQMKLEMQKKQDVDAVVLSSIHRVKGMERPVVFGIGLSDGILPHWASDPSIMPGRVMPVELPTEQVGSVGDERCACYVLCSRAKERLFLSSIMEYRHWQMLPSRFLYEMEMLNESRDDTEHRGSPDTEPGGGSSEMHSVPQEA